MPDPSQDPRRPEAGVQSGHRALDPLEVFAARGGTLAIEEIGCSGTGIPLPTAHRLLRTLVDRGYMRQTPDRGYALRCRVPPPSATASSMVGVGATARRPALHRGGHGDARRGRETRPAPRWRARDSPATPRTR